MCECSKQRVKDAADKIESKLTTDNLNTQMEQLTSGHHNARSSLGFDCPQWNLGINARGLSNNDIQTIFSDLKHLTTLDIFYSRIGGYLEA